MSQHPEQVILLDSNLSPIGHADKYQIHHQNTPLHLAFSCYLFNTEGQLLLTRRSLNKIAWPGVWTNSFCGHPLPGEQLTTAVSRRAVDELGADITDITCICENFSYFARDQNGIVENEFCPVYRATLTSTLSPNSNEVMDWSWVRLHEVLPSVRTVPFMFSPWMIEELATPSLVEKLLS